LAEHDGLDNMEEQHVQSNVYKKLFFALLFILTVGVVGLLAYFIGSNKVTTNNSLPTPTNNSSQPNSANQKDLSPTSEVKESADINIVPITANTVSFARVDGKTYLQYHGKIYDDTDQYNLHAVTLPDSDKLTWYGLVDKPSEVPEGQFMLDELFGFKLAQDKKSFAFIMRWGKDTPNISYYLYYYNPVEKTRQSLLVQKFSPNTGVSLYVAKIDQFSPEGNYLSLSMFPCWNCGGSKPETNLVRLIDNTVKSIGRTSYFGWKGAGAYEYKEYVVISCPPPPTGGEGMIGECSEKPENLPLKTGQF